nr:hypothetical protein Iba_chr03aCG1570 [Ipomoea batatas]
MEVELLLFLVVVKTPTPEMEFVGEDPCSVMLLHREERREDEGRWRSSYADLLLGWSTAVSHATNCCLTSEFWSSSLLCCRRAAEDRLMSRWADVPTCGPMSLLLCLQDCYPACGSLMIGVGSYSLTG